MVSCLASVFQHNGDTLAAPGAGRGYAVLQIAFVQLAGQGVGQTYTGYGQRVTVGDGAAVNIGPVAVQPQFLFAGQVLGGKGLVDFHPVDVVERHLLVSDKGANGRRRANAHDLGGHAHHRACHDAGQRLQAMGGSPSNTSVGETFEAISQGVLDGTVASSSDMISFRMDDVVDYVTTLPLGTYHSTISHTVGAGTWANLSPEHRRAIAESSSYASAMATQRWGYEMSQEAISNAEEKGVEFIEPTADLIEASERFKTEDLDAVPGYAADQDGISDAAAKVAEFQMLVNKWDEIAESVDNDPAAMAEQMNREIWDNVDFSSYGL